MVYNVWRSINRRLSHDLCVSGCTYRWYILDPQRVVNRAMYGTDYDPEDFGFGASGVIR